MSDIPEKAVEAALQAVTESGLNAWVTTEGMRAALAAALPHLASAQPQPSESDIRDIAAWVNSLPSDADIRVEARAAALDECEAIALEYGSAIIADAIAAQKRGPVAEEKSDG